MNRKKIMYIIKFISFATLACLGILFFPETKVFAGEMNFHAVFVGRGDALIIESNNHYMLVDSGTSAASSTLMNYLDKLDIPDKTIDYVVSTHPDGDHVGSFASIFDNYTIEHVIYSPCPKASTVYYNFIKAVKAEGCDYRTPVEGEKWNIGDATVQVIYNGSQGSTYNECSIVLKVTCDGKSILLTGDLPSTMERTLISQNYNLKADILKIGHHGAAASSCAKFLNAVKPSYAVVSCNSPNKTIFPRTSVLKRLARRYIKLYRTPDKDVVINIKNGVISTKNKENNPYISIKKGKITLSNNVYRSTGKALRPSATLYVNGIKVSPTQYKIRYSSNVNTGIAKVKLKATGTKYVSSCSTTFIILPKKETLQATVKKTNNVKLTWSSQSAATGFTIKYSTSKKFKSGVKYITINNSKKTGTTISKLKYNKTYYIKIRAYKSNVGNGKWSKTVKITTGKKPKTSEKSDSTKKSTKKKKSSKTSTKK